MFSKLLELTGFGMIAVGVGMLLGTAAGVICGGIALVFVGSVTDDASIGAALRLGAGRVRRAYRRQVAKEADQNGGSPHPPIIVDPQTEELARHLAKQRLERAKVHDRTPALSRYEPFEEEEV